MQVRGKNQEQLLLTPQLAASTEKQCWKASVIGAPAAAWLRMQREPGSMQVAAYQKGCNMDMELASPTGASGLRVKAC